jgi:hypothetical protein
MIEDAENSFLYSTALPELDGDLANVEVDEVLRLMGDERPEGTTDDAVPSRIVLLVEFLLDVCGDVLLMLKRSRAWVAMSIASVCISLDMSTFFTTARRACAMGNGHDVRSKSKRPSIVLDINSADSQYARLNEYR